MTREEQIIQASDEWTYQNPPQYSELVHKTHKVMCAYQIGFIDGAVWADGHPHWISVEDELPEKGDIVIVMQNGYMLRIQDNEIVLVYEGSFVPDDIGGELLSDLDDFID